MKFPALSSSKLRLWEAALLLAFGLTLTVGVWASASEGALADRVLRLHVIANSDSDSDQARKLLVRDAVLAEAAQILEGVSDRRDAEAALAPHLDELARAGEEALARTGRSDPVRVTLADQWFPTKEYDGFSLPAGQYRALKVTIGEGKGQNWWCVVFPPLCLASVSERSVESAAEGVLSEDQVALITGQDGGYVLKFRLIEWWQELMGGK
ncbi:MAG: stage II sporulation protein R [Oscillospiraceae bacterium]|nr:stage II sporulation protein R [Oscillospiraceae bacterium]MDE7171864.1 stage II sporulation protein R [Oscillospiraceae bacterium]